MPPVANRPAAAPANQLSPVEQAVLQMRGALGQMYHTLTRTRQKVYALEAAARLRAAGKEPALPVEFRSQFGEDLLLYDLFEGQLEGNFIEVGAFDGYNYSVTYALEAMGWKGLLIEAIPDKAEQCAKRRVNSQVVHAALSRRGSTGQAEFTVTTDQYGGMLSYHTTTAQHLRDTQPAPKSVVSVPLTSMDDLLEKHPPSGGEIDVAVIDVEGGEVALLQGFDLHKHRPKVLMIEDNSRGSDPALRNYMSTQPYVMCGWMEVNAVFVRADLTELQRRMARIFRA
ncbi:MAG: FkbM family methyltransferase [Phycisphaerales bacterium]